MIFEVAHRPLLRSRGGKNIDSSTHVSILLYFCSMKGILTAELERPSPYSKDRAGRGTPFSTPTPVPKSQKWTDLEGKDVVRGGEWNRRQFSLAVHKL
jgi:hypothetical protein